MSGVARGALPVRPMWTERFRLVLACITLAPLVGIFGVLAVSTPVSAASATWSIVPTPSPGSAGGSSGSDLSGISCISASACTAVGFYGNESTLIEQWNGTSWSVVPSPNPIVSYQAFWLDAVSCASASACSAVGYVETKPGTVPEFVNFAEQWNGTTWSVVPTPNPGGINGLSGVSCISASDCIAVGGTAGYTLTGGATNRQTLIEQWNGTTWTVVPSPDTSATDNDGLAAVSCTSASACTAVGYHSTTSSAPTQTLIEQWNGTTWSIVPSPSSSATQFDNLNGISCTSASACTAVGSQSTTASGPAQTLIEQWDGTTWSIVPSPNSSSSQYNYLDGVSCTSASACTAVGSDPLASASPAQTLIEQWDGTTWSIVPSPNPSTSDYLTAVSCPSTSACTAVGSGKTTSGFVETSATLPPGPPPAAGVGVNVLSDPLLNSAVSGVPTCWTPNSYGTNTPTFTYSANGGQGGGGQESLSVANYGSGTADLITTLDNGTCAPTVTPGNAYTASAYYESSVPVYFTLYSRSSTGAWSYRTQSPTFAPATTWTLATWTTPAVPTGVNGASIGLTLQSNGTLSTSDYSLVNDGVPTTLPPAAGVGVNALNDPQLNSAVSGVPTCWTPNSYGTSTPTFTYSATGGQGGGGTESLSVANYASGTADLITTLDNGTCAPTVTPGNTYTVSASYESSVPVYFTLYSRATNGSWSYWTQSPTFAPATTWTPATWTTPAVPTGVNGASFGLTLQSNGTLSTSNYSLVNNGPPGTLPPAAGVGVNALNDPQLTSAVSGVPSCWTANSYGTNTPTFTYNATGGQGGGGAESLSVANYASGTADLIPTLDNGSCAPTVTPGNNYTVSAYYESSVPVYFTLYSRSSTGTWSYWTQSPNFAPASTWTLATWTTQAVPAGVNGASFGLTLQSNGTLSTSNYSLVNDGAGGVPPAAGVGVNALNNPLLTSAVSGVPSCWTPNSYGTSTPTFTYSATGGQGSGGTESLSVANYASGTADLIATLDNGTCAPTVTPGNTYTVSAYYESSVPVYFTLYSRSSTGAWSYWTQSPNFAPANTWTLANWTTPAVPTGVNGASFGLTLQSNGTLSTSNYSLVNNG